jgi:hypothetical protein
VALFGPRTEGPFAPDIPLDHQRPAEQVFDKVVDEQLARLAAENRLPGKRRTAG